MTPSNVVVVVAWTTGALLAFSSAAVGIRELAGRLEVFEILMLRNLSGVAALGLLAALRPGLRPGLVPRRFPLHLARNLVHFGATYAWGLGLTLLPLAVVFAIEFTSPVWVALLAVGVLGERLTPSRLAAIVLGSVGVVVVLRPGVEALQPAALVVLACAFGFAVTAIATKRLTTTESTFSILFWMNLIQLPLNGAFSAPGFWLKLDGSMSLPLLGVFLGGLLSHYCLTNAYRHGDATLVVSLDFMRLPLIALVGWRFYGEPLDPMVFAGAAIIVAGVLVNLRAEARR